MVQKDKNRNSVKPVFDENTKLSPNPKDIEEARRIIKEHPDRVARYLVQMERIEERVEYFSGPLPPPKTLEAYKAIDPTFPDRILSMAENQAAHRQSIEKQVICNDSKNERLGTIFAFLLIFFSLLISAFLLYHGKGIESLAILMSTVVPVLIVFITGKSQQEKNLASKDQAMEENEPKNNAE